MMRQIRQLEVKRQALTAIPVLFLLIMSTHALAAMEVDIFVEKSSISADDPTQEISVSARTDVEIEADVHFVLISPNNVIYEWPNWNTVLQPALRLTFPVGFHFPVTPVFNAARFPGGLLPGSWAAALALTEPGTYNFYDIAVARFEVYEPTSSSSSQVDLVAYWSFEEGRGVETADVVGGLSSFIFGADFASNPAPNGGSFSLYCTTGFPSGSGSGDIAFNINEDSFSLSAWARTFGTVGNRIVTVGTGGTGQAYWLDITNGGMFGVQIGTATPLQIDSGFGDVLEDGNYHSLIAVHDATRKEIRLYVDGQQTASASTAGISGTVGGSRFSFCGGGNALQFNGYVDEIKIFAGVLSNSEIRKESGF